MTNALVFLLACLVIGCNASLMGLLPFHTKLQQKYQNPFEITIPQNESQPIAYQRYFAGRDRYTFKIRAKLNILLRAYSAPHPENMIYRLMLDNRTAGAEFLLNTGKQQRYKFDMKPSKGQYSMHLKNGQYWDVGFDIPSNIVLPSRQAESQLIIHGYRIVMNDSKQSRPRFFGRCRGRSQRFSVVTPLGQERLESALQCAATTYPISFPFPAKPSTKDLHLFDQYVDWEKLAKGGSCDERCCIKDMYFPVVANSTINQ